MYKCTLLLDVITSGYYMNFVFLLCQQAESNPDCRDVMSMCDSLLQTEEQLDKVKMYLVMLTLAICLLYTSDAADE